MKDKSSMEPEPGSGSTELSELLGAYFDGEISAAEAEAVRVSLKNDPDLSQSLHELKLIQATLREVIDEAPRGTKPLAIWQQIESRLEPYPKAAPRSTYPLLESPLFKMLRGMLPESQVRSGFGRPAWGIAAVCAAAALVIASQSKWRPSEPQNTSVALISETSVRDEGGALEGSQSSIPVVAMTASSDVIRSSGSFVTMPLSESRLQRTPFLRSLPLRVDRGQLIGMDPDLRMDGLDIERIKTKRPFKIVAANGRKAPPVIWVARGGDSMDVRQ